VLVGMSWGKVARDSTVSCVCLALVCDGGDAVRECAYFLDLAHIEAVSGADHGLFAGYASKVSS
jgi:hypothetical protein